MLGKTAGGLFWMFRFLERSENTARLIEVGFRIALTRSSSADEEWASVLRTTGCFDAYTEKYDSVVPADVIDFLLRDTENASSVMSVIDAARTNARMVRTALTREVWEVTNESWMTLKKLLAKPVKEADLPNILATIRRQSALVRGAMHGTMLRNDIFRFARIGTHLERADSTARILDVKYYVLLPSVSHVGSAIDNVHWETILQSVSAHSAFRWLNEGDTDPVKIADLILLDRRLPRSLAFCHRNVFENLEHLADDYGERMPCLDIAEDMHKRLSNRTIESVFDDGLHEFITSFIRKNNDLGTQIETDYKFYG